MRIKGLKLTQLRNLAHFEFHTEVKQLVTKQTPEKLNIVEAFDTYCTLLAKEEEGLEVIRKHKLTDEITELDEKRDVVFSSLVSNIRSLKHHFDTNIQENAKDLIRVLDNYGNLTRESYNEETAGLYKFSEELLNNYASQLTVCNLTDWVNHLKTLNEQFQTLMLTRNDNLTEKEPIHMRSVRKEVDAVYHLIAQRVEASALLNGENDYKDFVNELNGRIAYYQEHNL